MERVGNALLQFPLRHPGSLRAGEQAAILQFAAEMLHPAVVGIGKSLHAGADFLAAGRGIDAAQLDGLLLQRRHVGLHVAHFRRLGLVGHGPGVDVRHHPVG
ncbi:hypothetical protein SDC9_155848 [bioreactor metagenome]|uniref:Uncharacterized protein n=1 Tax=bioreactor metagenome TaxID=1076179 RepID=A0A645F2L5_9ZZZZ